MCGEIYLFQKTESMHTSKISLSLFRADNHKISGHEN